MDNTNPVEQQSESSSLSAHQSTQETKCCEVCGNIGDESLLMKCSQCNVTQEHTYCSQVFFPEVPRIWICEECRKSSRIFQVPPGARNPPRTPVSAPDTANDSSRVLQLPPRARIIRNERRRTPARRSPVPAPDTQNHDSSQVLREQPSARIRNEARRSSVAARDNENRSSSSSSSSSEISDARSVMVDLVDGAQSNLVAGDEGNKQKD